MKQAWKIGFAATLATVIGLGLMTSGAQAAPTKTSTAIAIPAEVSTFRVNVSELLHSFYSTYGSRLSQSEKTQMSGLIDQVDQVLGTLYRQSTVSAKLARTNAPMVKQRQAAATVAKTYDTAFANSNASMEKLQPIIAPKLSLFEALSAKSDLDQSQQEFEDLGIRIHQAAR
jgi:hypothetical protein